MKQFGKCIVRMNGYAKVVELRHIVRFCKLYDCDFVVVSDGNDFLFSIYKAGALQEIGTFIYLGNFVQV